MSVRTLRVLWTMRRALKTGQDDIMSYVPLWPVTVYIMFCLCRMVLGFFLSFVPQGIHMHSTAIKNLFSDNIRLPLSAAVGL